MPMDRNELDLMHELRRLSERIPGFALAFANDELAVDAELAFVHQLADMTEGLLRHANGRRGLTADGRPAALVIDMPYARLETARTGRELSAARPSSDTGS